MLNENEAQAAISRNDFTAKISLASKEADSLINITTKIVKSSQENAK